MLEGPPEAQQSCSTVSRNLQLDQLMWSASSLDLLNIAVIGPIHGFGSCLSGLLILSLATVCSRIGVVTVERLFEGMIAAEI